MCAAVRRPYHDSLKADPFPLARRFRSKCDEPLTYPLVSTGQSRRSGKLRLRDVVRSPIQAQFRLVFGIGSDGNGGPQSLEVTGDFIPRVAVASVHAPIWRRHAGGLGQRQVGSLQGSERRGGTGQAENLARGECSGTAKAPSRSPWQKGKGTRPRQERRRGGELGEAQAGRSDAQASRSEGRMPARAPVTNLWQGRSQDAGSERLDIGRQAWPQTQSEAEGSPEAGQAEGPSTRR